MSNLTSKQIKDGMVAGEWYYDHGDVQTADTLIASTYSQDGRDISGIAIITAVNSTYGAGINPLAVPDMVKMLEYVLQCAIMQQSEKDHITALLTSAKIG